MNFLFFLILIFIISIPLTIIGWRKSADKRQYLIKNSLYFILGLLLLFLFGPFFIVSPVKIGYQTQKSENKTIVYPRGWEMKKEQFIQVINQAEKDILEFYPQQFPVTLMLTKNSFDMFRFTGQKRGGNNSLGYIYISSSYVDKGLIAAELSHYYLFNTAKRSSIYFPRWFDEGLAIYLGHSGSTARFTQPEQLQKLLKDNRYPKNLSHWNGIKGQLRWMRQIFSGGYITNMYTHSYFAVRFLIDEYGIEKVQNLIYEIKTNPSFENVFQNIYGFSTNEFSDFFLNSAQQYIQIDYQSLSAPLKRIEH